jgi:hypothetical protein
MTRIYWILNSALVSHPKMRRNFIPAIEKQLNIDEGLDSLVNLPLNRIFDHVGNFRIEIFNSILGANAYFNILEQNENDRVLQKLIFLFLRYTQHKYPDLNSWEGFLTRSRESQLEEINREIETMWLDMQSQIITDEIMNDLN